MEWHGNLLPDAVSKWITNKATITGNEIVIQPGGYATTTILSDDVTYFPDFILSKIVFETDQEFDRYTACLWVRMEFVDIYDSRTVYTAWVRKTERLPDNTWLSDVEIDVNDMELKYIKYTVYAGKTSTKPIRVTVREIRASVALTKAQQDAVSASLPSLILLNNVTTKTINSTLSILLSTTFKLAASSNLSLHLIISGEATQDCFLTVDIQNNNKSVPYAPLTTKVSAGKFMVGIPGSVLQVQEGSNLLQILVQCSAGTMSIPINGAYATLEGKNLLGGYATSTPHAEIVQRIIYSILSGNYSLGNFVDIDIEYPTSIVSTDLIRYSDYYSAPIATLPFIELKALAVKQVYGSVDSSGNAINYDHDEYIIINKGMRFKDSYISTALTTIEQAGTYAIQEATLDNSSIDFYESITVQ